MAFVHIGVYREFTQEGGGGFKPSSSFIYRYPSKKVTSLMALITKGASIVASLIALIPKDEFIEFLSKTLPH